MFPVTVVNALDVSSWELESIPQAFSRILNSWSAAVALDFFWHSITPFLRNPCSGGVLPKSDPCVMRVSAARKGEETYDDKAEKKASHAGADCAEAS